MQGELISESGTMTGGGGKPRRGKMCLGSGAPAAAAALDGKEAAVLERDVRQLQEVRCSGLLTFVGGAAALCGNCQLPWLETNSNTFISLWHHPGVCTCC